MERAAWTSERLDDLAEAVRSGFTRVDGDLRDLRAELREEIRELRVEMREGFVTVRGDIDTLKSNLLRASLAAVIALIGVLAAVLTRI